MKIETSYKLQTPQTATIKRRAATTDSAKTTQTADTATLSCATKTQSPFDAAKVEEIKTAIAQGRFKINVDAIADGLIAMARELIEEKSL